MSTAPATNAPKSFARSAGASDRPALSAVGTSLLPLLGLLAVILLSACASGRELGVERAELGDFRLGHNIVVEENAQIGPLSRTAEPGAWTEALTAEIDRRFGRYEGDKLYHIAINVQAYVLAVPGVPLVLSPKSALILGVTVWDDAAGGKLNDTPHRITVLESLSAETAVSSGLTQSAEQQMQNLAENAGAAIERWMSTKPEWFGTTADAAAAAAAAPAPGNVAPAGTAPVVDPVIAPGATLGIVTPAPGTRTPATTASGTIAPGTTGPAAPRVIIAEDAR